MTLNKYKQYNNILAWIAFLIALITYFLTVEPTVSLWDCGEFIASTYKLEVGHPPGAPLFMLIGRFFSLFTSNPQNVALMINSVSVFSSAFTILFLFWTITYFAKKIIVKKNELTTSKAVVIFASGFAGALAYTFSDTFWFSAVEAEVYASSSLFTAVVFWAILKWETISEQKYSNKWLIFIAFMMGLSIGVHLLNLLAIPAIVFVYYFKKHKITSKGLFYSAIISVALVGFLMYGIIQGYVVLASKFELLFVNGLGLPYNSGLLFYIFLTFALLAYGIYYSLKKNKIILNTVLTAITVILIGYSSYGIIMIRSNANPPMDENNPENIFTLLSYLNREQYGSRPLIYGQYFDAKLKEKNGQYVSYPNYTYIPKDGEYLKIEKTNPDYDFDDDRKTIFPRMYSRDQLHISAYQTWGGVEPGEKPNFINNIQFFITYQLSHMYFRYFMWNFSGKQNNLQSHGGISKGNWISGIPFIDKMMIGNQGDLPEKMKNDKSRNKYYLLPFLLGFIGLLYTFSKDKRSFSVLFLLFFFTGIAIVVYLNQTPYQPRERDYAYAGSFYAFAIWIGLGITGIYNFLNSRLTKKVTLLLTVLTAVPVPLIMAVENWDDHDRSGRYTTADYAKNYLDSCDENAILFTYGDNDTFPLWYMQEVEGYRTDIKVVNLSLLGTDWYIDQMQMQSYNAKPVPFKMKHDKYREGIRDAVYITENPEAFIDEKYFTKEIIYQEDFNSIKENLKVILEKSEYSKENPEEYNTILKMMNGVSPVKFAGIVVNLSDEDFIKKYKIDKSSVDEISSLLQVFLQKISENHLPLNYAMDFVASDNSDTKLQANDGEEINYLPSKKLSLNVPWPKAAKIGSFTAKELSKFEKNIEWTINKTYLFKNDMAVLEIIARNNWERPIYFATSVPHQNYYGLQKYFRLEGFAYRLVPYKTEGQTGYINTDVMYDKLMTKFVWGRIKEDDVYIGNFDLRNIRIMAVRETYAKLASALINENKKEKAIEVLDRCIEILPENKIPYDDSMTEIVGNYFKTGEKEKAYKILDIIIKDYGEKMKYYINIGSSFSDQVYSEKAEIYNDIKQFKNITDKYNEKEYSVKLESVLIF
ncbi:MAG: DUF2723 domain-containing protein [Bacteroidales bacterium]|nr:DUF2723 domain-containing protein [Bacteroidales bacterium]